MTAFEPHIRSTASTVEQAFDGLAEITARTSTMRFEGGQYERLYIKPHSKLGSSLLTSREVLVLVARFQEVQARTIKMAEHCLADAKGRLEASMAIVFHEDTQGDAKLRDWGRERGITVLPVLVANGIPGGSSLQEALCAGLYSQDPFDLAGPVRLPHQFFGRTEIPDMARRLKGGHIQALFGIRKVGKTSVLNRILEEARDFHGMACVMSDCSDDSLSELDAGRLLNAVAAGINDALNHEETHYTSLMPIAEDISPAEAGRVLLSILSEAKRPVVLLLDEVDYITPSSPIAEHWKDEFNSFFRALRQVYQECCRREIAFSIVVCGVSSYWFTAENVGGVENAALALVPESYLPPLERRSSQEMVETLGRSAGLIFSSEACDQISATCADIPFWIRKAGSFIHSCFPGEGRPLRLNLLDVAGLCDEFVEVEGAQLAFSSLRHLFRIYPELSDVAVDCLNGRNLDRHPQHLLSALGRYGVLGEGFSPSGPMVKQGVRMWQRQEPILQELPFVDSQRIAVEAGSPSAAGEEEWADLLSEVSHRRNILERRLREFIVAVLRLECSSKQDGRKPVDIILAAVPAERRTVLGSKNSGSLMKALFWSELLNVMKKNWPIFQRHFQDRKQLDLYSDIISDRPDAHAKDFDGADLALQRRAISWFEDRIEGSGML